MEIGTHRFEVLDGYRLIRFLGRGGFGEVWLCRSESMGDYRALKFIPTTHTDRLDKEYDALLHYRKAAAQLRSPHLVPIEHVGQNDAGLYYVMPLADGLEGVDPANPAWVPLSFTTLIQDRSEMPAWFSSSEIIEFIRPILEALQTLTDAGLVHRDVKPENILFFNGKPCLGDISLLGVDASEITRRGTPGYVTPSWYVGGHPDMYGVAATLYTLLTGNSPDRMGRAAFIWPPQGEESLTLTERVEWKLLHGVIRRASDEKVAERFVDFRAMAGALSSQQSPGEAVRRRSTLKVFLLSLTVVICVGGFWLIGRPESDLPEIITKPDETASVSVVTSKCRDNAYLVQNVLGDTQEYMTTTDENSLYIDMLEEFQMHTVMDEQNMDFPKAIQALDSFLNAMPHLKKIPNIQLSRLLLQQCADGRPVNLSVVDDPAFIVMGNDDFRTRVALLCSLGAEDKAEEFLEIVFSKESLSDTHKSYAFLERTRVRAMLGKLAEARSDAEQFIKLGGDNQATQILRQKELINLAQEIPAFADYLKLNPVK